MDIIEWTLSHVAEVPTNIVLALGILISATLSILAVRRDQKFEKIRPQGGTKFVARTLQTTILALILVISGIGIITTFKEDVPTWASFWLPLVVGLFAVSLILGQLAPRGSFTWSRFWNIVFVPIVSTVVPLGAAAARHLPSALKELFI